jgi:hypothetical protein
MGEVKKTGSITERVGPVPAPKGSIKEDGGGTCYKGTADPKSGAAGKQTGASSRRTKM